MSSDVVAEKVERLNNVSAGRVVEYPDVVPGRLGDGQVLPDELLSVAGLDLDLSAEQRRTLSREETASIATSGIKFEAVLMAGFALQIVDAPGVTDPRLVYLLHEIGEETRHSRLFIEMVEQLAPTAHNPLDKWWLEKLFKLGSRRIVNLPALLYTLVLGGEEIPDLFQKLAAEHPDTDPYIRAVNRYHRQEEARHLSYARAVYPEIWEKATFAEKVAVRYVAPLVIGGMFDTIVHPGVYETVGLDGWATWKAANSSATRVAMRHRATRPVLATLVDAGVFRPGRVARGWQRLCGVDRAGEPV